VRQTVLRDRIFQRPRDVRLADQIVERLGSIFPGEHFVAHALTLNALLGGRKQNRKISSILIERWTFSVESFLHERKIAMKQTSVHCEWVLNRQFIEFHYGAADAKPEYEAFVFVGFDDSAKNYVCHWVDVFGAKDSELGRGKIDDKLLAIEFKFGNGELTNKFTFDPQKKTWTSLIRQIEKGEWKTFAEEKWTKK
jgi:hypothetical protein